LKDILIFVLGMCLYGFISEEERSELGVKVGCGWKMHCGYRYVIVDEENFFFWHI